MYKVVGVVKNSFCNFWHTSAARAGSGVKGEPREAGPFIEDP